MTNAMPSTALWVKVVEMLQQNWASIDDQANGRAVVSFVSDDSGIFDRMIFPSRAAAEEGLRRNGFKYFDSSPRLQSFLAPPRPPFGPGGHPIGPIYSSGRFWEGPLGDGGDSEGLRGNSAQELALSGRLRVATDPGELAWKEFPKPSWNRAEGMLLGLAIGDSLGNTSESLVPVERLARYGEIRDYLPNCYADGRAVGLPSDDTQLAFRTLEHMLEEGRINPDRLGNALASGQIFGLGSTVRAFLAARADARHWLDAAQESAGNGALMRIAPVILPHLASGGPELWRDVVVAGAVTHNDYASNAACGAFAGVLLDAMAAKPPVWPRFWLDAFVDRARILEGTVPRYVSRVPGREHARVRMWEFVQSNVEQALRPGVQARDACDSWYSGAFLLETVPSALYILERHGNDPEEAIVRAVNDTKDNDTVAAIVGAAVGALHGVDALPPRWRAGLLGRTGVSDDGRVQQLVELARVRWG